MPARLVGTSAWPAIDAVPAPCSAIKPMSVSELFTTSLPLPSSAAPDVEMGRLGRTPEGNVTKPWASARSLSCWATTAPLASRVLGTGSSYVPSVFEVATVETGAPFTLVATTRAPPMPVLSDTLNTRPFTTTGDTQMGGPPPCTVPQALPLSQPVFATGSHSPPPPPQPDVRSAPTRKDRLM